MVDGTLSGGGGRRYRWIGAVMARVKIKDHDHRPHVSITIVIAAALAVWFVGAMWSAETRLRPVRRKLIEHRMVYECDRGHRFVDFGDTKSRPCPVSGCETRAWPVWSFQCSKHGASRLRLRYSLGVRGEPRITRVRLIDGASWQDVGDVIICPRCDRVLVPDLSLRDVPPPGDAQKENEQN